MQGIGGFGLGWLGVGIRCVTLGAVVWLGLRVLTRCSDRGSAWLGRALRHPVLLMICLALFTVLLQAAAVAVPNQVIYRTDVRIVPGFLAIDCFFGPGAMMIVLFLLFVSATRFESLRRGARRVRSTIVPVMALSCFLLSGCGQAPSTEPASAADQKTGAPQSSLASQTAFEKCLGTWSAGDFDAAIQEFLPINLKDAKLFSAGSALSMSEAQFVALPQAARERLSAPMMNDLDSIKALCVRVKEAALDAKRKGVSSDRFGKRAQHLQSLALGSVPNYGNDIDQSANPIPPV